jgi:hypothetical protein
VGKKLVYRLYRERAWFAHPAQVEEDGVGALPTGSRGGEAESGAEVWPSWTINSLTADDSERYPISRNGHLARAT